MATLQTITSKLQAQTAKLQRSNMSAVTFTLCGIRCRIAYGLDTAMHYGYKRPLMSGFEPCTLDGLASHLHRFQY